MESKNVIKTSVRNLVEFVLMSGDLVSEFSGSSRNVEAIKAHQIVQKSSGQEYTPEVTLSYVVEREDISLEISGRADGVINTADGITIDEIKTTTKDFESIHEDYNKLHWAQAECYAFIYAKMNALNIMGVQLTYYQLDTKEIKRFSKTFNIEELETLFMQVVEKYLDWARVMRDWIICRDTSVKQVEFPFAGYRNGQRELAVTVYRTIRDGNKLFAQAPTGIGKTIATLFPSIKALGEGITSKLFYLTAKTITREIAEKAFANMRKSGLRFKTLTITAKDKVCFCPKASCNAEECEFAKGYYDKVRNAIEDIFSADSFTRPVIEEYAMKHRICPFEFSLDISLWCDCIICDYNYVFDPRVYLRRFFMDAGGDYTFLIDEAHNLVDRSREMFSAELFKKSILDLKRSTKSGLPAISKTLNKINSYMIKARKACEETGKAFIVQKEPPKDIYPLLRNFVRGAEKWLVRNEQAAFREELLDFYFKVTSFIRTSEYYDERYVTYFEEADNDVRIKLFCLDPAYLLSEAAKRGKCAIFFSATLNPMDYFVDILGGNGESAKLRLKSPFPRENLCLLIDDRISTRYKVRELTYERVAKSITGLVNGKVGNYLIYFPSYKYMNEIIVEFTTLNPDTKIIYQKSGMSEQEREEFLQEFSKPKEETLVGFAVMGGVFGEGIDLAGDMLSGAVIVGVGLPQICLERDIIRDYFERTKGMGFEFAYTYPGMNKVMQAVGRVIRTEKDRGAVLLIDERFTQNEYKRLFPMEWEHAKKVGNPGAAADSISRFWEQK